MLKVKVSKFRSNPALNVRSESFVPVVVVLMVPILTPVKNPPPIAVSLFSDVRT